MQMSSTQHDGRLESKRNEVRIVLGHPDYIARMLTLL